MLISVVMPVYNAAAWLPESLESVLAQSYPHWELLLVDDGSTDGSGELAERYAQGDARIRVFHQSNAGASAARNGGIAAATGDYLCFIDADDHVRPDYLKDLAADLLPDQGYGLIIHGLEERSGAGVPARLIRFTPALLQGQERLKAFTETEIFRSGYSASKLYDLRLIRTHQLRFDERVRHAEDLLFMLSYIEISDYIRFNDKCNYIYEHRGISLSHSNRPYRSERSCYEHMKNHLTTLRHLFGLPENGLPAMEASLSLFLIRALPALYRPPYTLPRRERLRELSGLSAYDLTLLQQNYHPYRKAEQWGKRLLLKRLFRLYDLFMSVVFGIRYGVVEHFRK